MKYTRSNPDFTQTIYSILEEKLARKLSPKENEKFYWTSGMYKEYFYAKLDKCTSPEQAEYLFNNGSLIGFPGYDPFEGVEETKPQSLLSKILEIFGL